MLSVEDRIGRLTELFEQHADSVFHVAWRILWSVPDAEDVVQTTFLRAFTRLDQLRDAERVRPWLLQIAYHGSLEVVRRRRDVPTDPARLPERPAPDDPAARAERRELAARLHAAVDALPENLRVAFVLRDAEGLAIRDVAGVLGIGESAAKMRVARAREQLRLALQGSLS